MPEMLAPGLKEAVFGYQMLSVTVSARSVNIAVGSPVTAEDAAIMVELAEHEAGVSVGNVKIIPIDQ